MSTPTSPSTFYKRVPSASWCIINGNGYITSRRDGSALKLNRLATMVWSWLRDGHTREELEQAIEQAYKEANSAATDMHAFLDELLAHELINEHQTMGAQLECPQDKEPYERPAFKTMKRDEACAFAS